MVAKLNGGLPTYKRSRSTNFPVNFNIYERIGPELFSAKTLNIMEACSTWDSLRDMCLGITDTVSEAKSPDASWDLSLLLTNPHYYATNVVLTDQENEPGWDAPILSIGIVNGNIGAGTEWISKPSYQEMRTFDEENRLNLEIGSQSQIKIKYCASMPAEEI